MGVLGALIERGEDHRCVWTVLGVSAPQRTGQIEFADLYSDAVECLHAAREAGYVVGIAGNQPAGAVQQLNALGFAADFVGSSTHWGVAKPSREFFERVLAVSGFAPEQVLYVGDRLDNDILPARDLGMRTAFLRRGPWGYLHALRAQVASADLRISSLDELTELVRRKRLA